MPICKKCRLRNAKLQIAKFGLYFNRKFFIPGEKQNE